MLGGSQGARVLNNAVPAAIAALGDSVRMAQQRAYEYLTGIQFDGMQFRTDIGWRAIKAR